MEMGQTKNSRRTAGPLNRVFGGMPSQNGSKARSQQVPNVTGDKQPMKLGIGVAFVTNRLKRLPQVDETWKADFKTVVLRKRSPLRSLGTGEGKYHER